MTYHPQNIIVAGSPGALVNHVTKHLARKGWAIKWPDQDLDISYGRAFYEHNGQNYEVQAIQQMICDTVGTSVLSAKLPVYFDVPYPGPTELAAKFKGKAVFSAPSLPPFLDIWRTVASIVIDIQCSESTDIAALADWTKKKFTDDYLQAIRQTYVSRYHQHLKLFPKVFTITNAEIGEKRLDGLDHFLNSAI